MAGKLDAIVFDRPSLEYFTRHYAQYVLFPEPLGQGGMVIGVSPEQSGLVERVNAFIRRYKADGTYDQMVRRWLRSENPTMPPLPEVSDPEGTLTIGTSLANEPMGFCASDGLPTGFDIEFGRRLAHFLNLRPEFREATRGSLALGTESGKFDLVIASIETGERNRASMISSDNYIDSEIVLLTHRDAVAESILAGESGMAESNAAVSSAGDSADRTGALAMDNGRLQGGLTGILWWKTILRGLSVTWELTFFALFFGTLAAFVLCAALRSSCRFVRYPVVLFTTLLRATPLVVLLLILYYGLAQQTKTGALWASAVGLALYTAVPIAELFAGAVASVPISQRQGVLALGFSRFGVFRYVVFPQAVGMAWPGYTRRAVDVLKATSVVGYITVADLAKVGDLICGRTDGVLLPLLVTTVFYWAAAGVMIGLLSLLAKRFGARRVFHSTITGPQAPEVSSWR